MLHVGAAPDHSPLDETPVCAQVSAMLEDRKNVASHANVAVEPWLFVAVRVGPLPLVGADRVGHVAIVQVVVTEVHVPATVHVETSATPALRA